MKNLTLAALAFCFLPALVANGQSDAAAGEDGEILEGHSFHGEAFNDGPRQGAYLMEGLGHTSFPVTTSSARSQQFFDQGIAQLHGFWYFEAERSFRQCAAIDPKCAMAFWGMAMANRENPDRARGFIAKAYENRENCDKRELMYIESLYNYHQESELSKKDRDENLAKDLEVIAFWYPDDIEVKAFLAVQRWHAGSIKDHQAVDALLEEIFRVNPMHSAHHYRIHLWDYEEPERALQSAAECGPSSPAIAHMWHMPGHIYSRLKRYDDAAWQQEASARVDHAHMIRDRVMPDQIHNFAHNNEWLIRDLNHIGRVSDAVDLAKNMIELPRHPKYNTLSEGSYRFGRARLFETLSRYELWDQLIELCDSPYLPPTDDPKEQVKRLRFLGRAYFRSGDSYNGQQFLQQLRDRVAVLGRQTGDDLPPRAQRPGQVPADKNLLESTRREALHGVRELEGLCTLADGEVQLALELLDKAANTDEMFVSSVRLRAGDAQQALKSAEEYVSRHENEVAPLAAMVQLLWDAGEKGRCKETLDQLRENSSSIDLHSPVFQRIAPIARSLGITGDWRMDKPLASDLGARPPLDELGPFRWSPTPAPTWMLENHRGQQLALEQFRGQPVIVIFYLGFGCLHCVEQLQAMAPRTGEFEELGIKLVGIGSDDLQGLRQALRNYGENEMPIPLVADPQLTVFKKYRAYDDFEKQPLHGTFLIDEQGLVRWQDISYEPFMDTDFLLQEARRLLKR